VDPGKRMGILEEGNTLDSAGNGNPDYPARDLENAILAMLPRVVFTSDDSQCRTLLSQMTEGSSMEGRLPLLLLRLLLLLLPLPLLLLLLLLLLLPPIIIIIIIIIIIK
jgi:hypothetical protein